MFGIGVPELIILAIVIGIPGGIIYAIRRNSAKSAAAEPQEPMELASNGKRFINFIVDLVIFRFAVILIVIPFAASDFVQALARNSLLNSVFGIVLYFLYYFFFETLFQRTPAKFLTGTSVVMLDGSKPEAAAIIKRSLSRVVPFEPFSGIKGKWWHDKWSKTRIVKA